ncbi:MAG: hypothetical protein HUJ75_03915, partial [Parasporobacterium sp.]|nr:hypothetical protein [Parasporobacterium sp.]
MFFVTIVSSSFAIALTLLVLAAIQTNKDRTESTTWLKRAMMVNMAGLLVLTITSVCASHFAGFFGNTANESYRICCVLRELANIFFIPMCAMVSEYIRTICHNKAEISAVVD